MDNHTLVMTTEPNSSDPDVRCGDVCKGPGVVPVSGDWPNAQTLGSPLTEVSEDQEALPSSFYIENPTLLSPWLDLTCGPGS